MTITTPCPSCGRGLRIPEHLAGSLVRCPGCQATFTAEGTGKESPPAAPADRAGQAVTDEPPRANRRPAPEAPPYEERPAERYEDEPDDYEEFPRRRGPSRARVREMVAAPATALTVAGCIGVAIGVLLLLMAVFIGILPLIAPPVPNQRGGPPAPPPVAALVIAAGYYGVIGVAGIACASVIIYGANQMKNLRSRGWALAGCIAALVPCWGCWILGLPFGIWALVVFNKPEVQRAFD